MPIYLPPISRRRFLAGSLAAGASALSGRRLAADEPAVDPDSFVFLSDTHIMRRRTDEKHGVNPAETFRQATADIAALATRPARVFVTGDCAEGGDGGYPLFVELVQPLRRRGLPLHLALGNHDSREKFPTSLPDRPFLTAEETKTPNKLVSIVETPRANWFLLDSLYRNGTSAGYLGEAQRAWLAKALDARPNKPALILAHHHLDPIGRLKGLVDTQAFLDVLLPRRQVKAYFFGHLHMWSRAEMKDLHCVSLPATAWLFDRNQPRGFVAAKLRRDGITLTLHSLDRTHGKHGEKVDLQWRV